MTVLEKFVQEFNRRHDFEDSDIDILKERHPNIEFQDIPVAWIVIIDQALSRLRYKKEKIKSVRQEYGQLIFQFDLEVFTPKTAEIIHHMHEQIKKIDKDLYENFDYEQIQKEIINNKLLNYSRN